MFDASKVNTQQFGSEYGGDKRNVASESPGQTVASDRRAAAHRRGPRRGERVVPPLNPFALFGSPESPMRMMFAPLEIALYLPAYAIDTFNGHRPLNETR